jgi:hypothetical protein
LRQYIGEAGRRPSDVGIEGRVAFGQGNPDEWAKSFEDWQAIGATHIGLNTMGAGLSSPREHIDAIRRFKDAVGRSDILA